MNAEIFSQVLVRGEFGWEFCSNGSVPADAVVAGHTGDGEPLYVGRVLHNGSQTVGKVHSPLNIAKSACPYRTL
jgi:hypothetical protein